MVEEKFKLDSFIGGWYIDKKICDDLVTFFEKNPHRQRPGMVGKDKTIKKDFKESTDICLSGGDTIFDSYNKELQKCLIKYMERYPEIETHLAAFNSMVEGYNLQKYLPGQGFKGWHCERDNGDTRRCLVFMTYLNDVKNGGTIFKYQDITTQAKKGLTLIWPTDFSHVHKGQVCNETKYIVTGWYNYV